MSIRSTVWTGSVISSPKTGTVAEELAAYGAGPDWFTLGDRDIATHLVRTRMLGAGYGLAAVTEALCRRWQPGVRLLPMTEQPVETHVLVDDPDRRAWHRSSGVLGADEDVARELEGAGLRAHERGAPAIALAALERSATLSADEAARASRLLRAADVAFELGRPDLVRRFLDEAEPALLASGPTRDHLKVFWQRRLLSDAEPLDDVVSRLNADRKLDADARKTRLTAVRKYARFLSAMAA